jgi:hypothetical protein
MQNAEESFVTQGSSLQAQTDNEIFELELEERLEAKLEARLAEKLKVKIEEGVAERLAEEPPIRCSKCGKGHLHRVARRGFLQTKVYPLFGYYPWECSACRRISLVRKRLERRRSKNRSKRSE